jgi:16S rRNA (adenine1518-N6/adenine1519-N6)-dimethyltransferase
LLRRPPPEVDRALFGALVRAGFSQRRKTLRSSLASVLPGRVEEVLAAAGVDPGQRAEQVAVGGFVEVTRAATVAN